MSIEMAIPLATVSKKLIYLANNSSLLWRWKPFLLSDLAALIAKSVKTIFNVRKGSDYPAAWLTWNNDKQYVLNFSVSLPYAVVRSEQRGPVLFLWAKLIRTPDGTF